MKDRKALPKIRLGATTKTTVGSVDLYVTVNFFDSEGFPPAEIFVRIAKEGSFTRGMFDILAKQFSLLLQSGWTIEELIEKLGVIKFEGSELFGAILKAADDSTKAFHLAMNNVDRSIQKP